MPRWQRFLALHQQRHCLQAAPGMTQVAGVLGLRYARVLPIAPLQGLEERGPLLLADWCGHL